MPSAGFEPSTPKASVLNLLAKKTDNEFCLKILHDHKNKINIWQYMCQIDFC